MRRQGKRTGVSLPGLALGVAGVWGLLVLARLLGASPLQILLLGLVVFEVASVLWGADSRGGRDWPRNREWGNWTGRRVEDPPRSPVGPGPVASTPEPGPG
jgi:hypothetical protein